MLLAVYGNESGFYTVQQAKRLNQTSRDRRMVAFDENICYEDGKEKERKDEAESNHTNILSMGLSPSPRQYYPA